MTEMLPPCSCGEAHPHEVMRRTTADGKIVVMWSDGAITGVLGSRLRGVPAGPVRTASRLAKVMSARRRFMEWVSVYPVAELGRAFGHEPERPKGVGLTLHWTTLSADRAGRPTLRVCVLPRLLWPGLAVFRERGRYEVVRRVAGSADTYESSGFFAKNLAELRSVLELLAVDGVTGVAP